MVQFVKCLFHSSEILLIYLNDLCCFRVLGYVLLLQCGNSPEHYCVLFWGVTSLDLIVFLRKLEGHPYWIYATPSPIWMWSSNGPGYECCVCIYIQYHLASWAKMEPIYKLWSSSYNTFRLTLFTQNEDERVKHGCFVYASPPLGRAGQYGFRGRGTVCEKLNGRMKVECVYSKWSPSPHIYMPPRGGARPANAHNQLGETTRRRHMQANQEGRQGRFGQTNSSADPLQAPLSTTFRLLLF